MSEAENLIRRVLEELADPAMGGATCTPALLLEKTKMSLDVIDSATANFSLYNNDPSSILFDLYSVINCLVPLKFSNNSPILVSPPAKLRLFYPIVQGY